MSETRQICTVKKLEASTRKITVEFNGKLIEAEKGVGVNFQIDDFACLLTSSDSNLGLVVALNSEELLALKKNEVSKKEDKITSKKIEPQNQKIPSDNELEVEKFLESKNPNNSTDLIRGLINDPLIMDKINTIFDGVDENEVELSLRDAFPIVAIQTTEEYQTLKVKVYKKADEMLRRKMVNALTNREVHQYLTPIFSD